MILETIKGTIKHYYTRGCNSGMLRDCIAVVPLMGVKLTLGCNIVGQLALKTKTTFFLKKRSNYYLENNRSCQ